MSSVLPWYLLLVPLVSALVIFVFTRPWPTLSSYISVAAVLISFGCACALFASPADRALQITWLDFRPMLFVPIGFTLDQLAKTMLLVVTSVGGLIHIYSLGYMGSDDGKARYFASLSLFMFAMIGIVLANNFVMMFIFWELVGVCSYLLIGHWYERDAAAKAANKAFITNRLGDFGFMLGILLMWSATRSVVFTDIAASIGKLSANPAFLTAAALLVFCGAVGKSAQFPLHVWLPDAMEGPTPISALIHAATMVAAGVYMLVRVGFLVSASPAALNVITWIGTITAVMAALIATQQNDIKRILAYSTLSQLGYMVMAVGLASGEAAMFHLFTHAFFKALLFLGAGSIIFMLHHEQNIWKMGGLAPRMAVTFLTFAVATLALIGCPPFSGFWSKDAILAIAFERNTAVFGIALCTAFLTAFYMTRLVVVVFFGKPRSDSARNGFESPWVMLIPLVLLAVPSLLAGFGFAAARFLPLPQEKTSGMTVPALATGAMLLGVALAVLFYRNREAEPIAIRALRRKFYFDELYAWLVRHTQGALAVLAAFIDRWIVDAGAVGGASAGTWSFGAMLRLFQVGNLQAYAFLFGLGIIGLLYFTIFR